MWMKMNVVFGSYLLFCSGYYVVNAKPLSGFNIRNAQQNEFPYVVSIMRVNMWETFIEDHACTGTLVTRRDVICCDHCIAVQNVWETTILAGSIDLRECTSFNIFWWITHDQWAAAMNLDIPFELNDVALIRLLVDVPSEIVPIQISNAYNNDFYGTEAIIAGWGQFNESTCNTILQVVCVTVLSNADCVREISILEGEELILDPEQVLCTSANPRVILTSGDSGGPLMVGNVLIGINKGTCPDSLPETDLRQINLHMAIELYRHFIWNLITVP